MPVFRPSAPGSGANAITPISLLCALDAGRDLVGPPLFPVMEMVDGIPVTEYCQKHELTLRQRLELASFLSARQSNMPTRKASSTATSSLPQRFLVTVYDGKPVPKVIDFGIAKSHAPTADRTQHAHADRRDDRHRSNT